MLQLLNLFTCKHENLLFLNGITHIFVLVAPLTSHTVTPVVQKGKGG